MMCSAGFSLILYLRAMLFVQLKFDNQQTESYNRQQLQQTPAGTKKSKDSLKATPEREEIQPHPTPQATQEI